MRLMNIGQSKLLFLSIALCYADAFIKPFLGRMEVIQAPRTRRIVQCIHMPHKVHKLDMSTESERNNLRPRRLAPLEDPSWASQLRTDAESRAKFRNVMEKLVDAEDEYELPGIISEHIHILLNSDCDSFFSEMTKECGSEIALGTLTNAYDFLLAFLEEFVEHAEGIQQKNQALLNEILNAAQKGVAAFEEKIAEVRDKLDVTMLKYLDSESERLKLAGGQEALGVVTIMRARISAEIDRNMGIEVSLLNNLLGFQERFMMRSALRANFETMNIEQARRFLELCAGTLDDVQKREDKDLSLEAKLVDILQDAELMSQSWIGDGETQP